MRLPQEMEKQLLACDAVSQDAACCACEQSTQWEVALELLQ